MKKRFLMVLLAAIAALCMAFGFAGCDSANNDNTGKNPPVVDPNGNKEDQGDTTPTVKEYTVTYNANGGAFSDGQNTYTQTVKDGNKLTAPTSPARENYTFAGWAKSKNGSTMWKFDEDTVSENTTLFAQWSQESAIILSVEGASIEDREIFMLVDHTIGEISLSSKVLCSDDSIWRLYSDPEGQREIPTKMVTNLRNGDNKYYIVVNSQNQAQVNVYQLTVHRSYLVTVSYYDGDSLFESVETYTGNVFTAEDNPNIAGYTFHGWKTQDGTSFTSDVLWAPLSLYADKTANTYKVTLDVNEGNALSQTEKTMTYDKAYSLPVPKRTGYSFLGWYSGGTQLTDADGKSLTAWNFTSDKQLTAHWKANIYTVTLNQNDSNAGTVSGSGGHAYDSQVTITATTNVGYNFLGWYDKDDKLVTAEAQYTFKMGFAVSYTAKWDYYTVTTTLNNSAAGSLSKYYTNEKVSVGTQVTLTATANMGFIWEGWYSGDEIISEEATYQFIMARENVSVEARWTLDPVMENFKFTSNSSSCTISGVVDTSWSEYVIPEYVTMIKMGAFSGCTKLTEITIPFVGNGAKETHFGYIFGASSYQENDDYVPESLKKVTITGGFSIADSAFCGCTELTEIEIPESVTSIGNDAFWGCTGLKSVTIGNGVTSIGVSAFNGCTGLTKIEIPNSVTEIKTWAFEYCTELTKIEIPDSLTSIGNDVFYGTAYYNTDSNWERGLLYLENYLIDAEYDLSGSVSIRPGTKLIAGGAFSYCSGLTSITIPDSVTSIGDRAFEDCTRLTEIEIPESVTSIGGFAFDGCKNLTTIRFHGTTAQWKAIEKNSNWRRNSPIKEVICNNGTLTGDEIDENL